MIVFHSYVIYLNIGMFPNMYYGSNPGEPMVISFCKKHIFPNSGPQTVDVPLRENIFFGKIPESDMV